MKTLQPKTEVPVNCVSTMLPVEWFHDEPVSLELRRGRSLRPDHQTKKERSYHVKLVNNLPHYRSAGSPVRVRRNSRHCRVARPGVVCRLPRAVRGIAHLWPATCITVSK